MKSVCNGVRSREYGTADWGNVERHSEEKNVLRVGWRKEAGAKKWWGRPGAEENVKKVLSAVERL
jgi:hypothetical protein